MKGGWIYIMTNRPNGTLYIGVTNNIARRAFEHRTGIGGQFTKRYGLRKLVVCRTARGYSHRDSARKEHERLAPRLESQACQPEQS